MLRYCRFLFLIICCFLLAACRPTSLSLDEESSSIVVDSDSSTLIIQTLIENEREWKTETLYAEFEVLNEGLAHQLETSTLYYNTNQRGIPEQFSIDPEFGRLLHEQFDYMGTISEKELQNNIQVNVYNERHDLLQKLSMKDVNISYR